MPRGIPHAFSNAGVARMASLGDHHAARFEGYFEEMAVALVAGDSSQPDPQRVSAIQERYGLLMDNDSIPLLVKRYGLILSDRHLQGEEARSG